MELPIGTIIAWAGPQPTVPPGWLLCNGDQVSRLTFPDLCNVIQDYWGAITGNPQIFHRLPDLRGVFLRGVTMERSDQFSDPDVSQRTHQKPGVSNDVGSFQKDSIIRHTHDLAGFAANRQDWKAGGNPEGNFVVVHATQTTTPVGSTETRPRNAYVHYIIRALPQPNTTPLREGEDIIKND